MLFAAGGGRLTRASVC
eukprot:ctg_6314.g772